MFQLTQAKLNNNYVLDLTDEIFLKVLKEGFFQVEIPENIKADVELLKFFTGEFFRDNLLEKSPYRDYNEKFNRDHPDIAAQPIQGYQIDRDKPTERGQVGIAKSQAKRINLVSKYWHLYPDDVHQAILKVERIGQAIINQILDWIAKQLRSDLSKDMKAILTGGVTNKTGSTYALFNYYDPREPTKGLGSHMDYGWITMLLSPIWIDEVEHGESVYVGSPESHESGLEAKVNGEWTKISPEPGHFVVNFGSSAKCTTEKLPEHLRIHACEHRVAQQSRGRGSAVIFLDPSVESKLYKMEFNSGFYLRNTYKSYIEHAIEENDSLY